MGVIVSGHCSSSLWVIGPALVTEYWQSNSAPPWVFSRCYCAYIYYSTGLTYFVWPSTLNSFYGCIFLYGHRSIQYPLQCLAKRVFTIFWTERTGLSAYSIPFAHWISWHDFVYWCNNKRTGLRILSLYYCQRITNEKDRQ